MFVPVTSRVCGSRSETCCVEACQDIVWSGLSLLQDTGLKKLVESLNGTVLKSKEDSTMRKYLYAIDCTRRWDGTKSEITEFPIVDFQFALYLQHIDQEMSSKSAVEEAINSASWLQKVAGLPCVSQSPLVKMTLAGLMYQLVKTITKKRAGHPRNTEEDGQ